jgi:hypothetical protein
MTTRRRYDLSIMNPRPQPDPIVRWVSHAIVALGVGYFIGRRTGLAGFVISAVVSTAAHEYLDAPVAQLLSDAGA